MEFTQPEKRCPKGHLIPDSGYVRNKDGSIRRKLDGNAITTAPQLICQVCAEAAEVPEGVRRIIDPPKRLRKGEVVKEQTTIREIMGPIRMLHL